MLIGSILLFLWFPAVAHQLLQLIEKALHIRELAVDGGKADIRHLVDLFQFLHGQLTNAHTGDLTVVGAEQGLLNAADRPLQ